MTQRLKSYLCGEWHEGEGEKVTLHDPTTEEVVAEVRRGGHDLAAALTYARERGGPTLRAMSFAERGQLLQAMADAWHAHRDTLLQLSTRSGGNTRGDAKFDLDGATGTLSAYACIGAKLGDARFLIDGDSIRLARSPRFVGRHIRTPRVGVAVHINAYNFPAWGMAEKAACAILAGMPVLTKPATSTAMLAERMMRILVEDEVLPAGVLSMLVGSAGDLLEHVRSQDVVAFTGSAATGRSIRSGAAVVEYSVRVNVEADSLNSAVLGPDVEQESATWDLMVREVTTDMTQKAGQKCTAIRRIFVPQTSLDAFREDLIASIAGIRVGDPAVRGVRMGPLATKAQLADVQAGIAELLQESDLVHGVQGCGDLLEVAQGKGYFQAPVLLLTRDTDASSLVHQRDVFGPVATLLPSGKQAGQPGHSRVAPARRRAAVIGVHHIDPVYAT